MRTLCGTPLARRPNTVIRAPSTWSLLFDDVDGLFDRAFADLSFRPFPVGPSADVAETEESYRIRVDLPGTSPKEIAVSIEANVLTIRAERKVAEAAKGETFLRSERGHGVYARAFTLPHGVDASKVGARYEHGVLTVTVPKTEAAKPRSIQVDVA